MSFKLFAFSNKQPNATNSLKLFMTCKTVNPIEQFNCTEFCRPQSLQVPQNNFFYANSQIHRKNTIEPGIFQIFAIFKNSSQFFLYNWQNWVKFWLNRYAWAQRKINLFRIHLERSLDKKNMLFRPLKSSWRRIYWWVVFCGSDRNKFQVWYMR